jgi:predicted nuclease with RNAse H fold
VDRLIFIARLPAIFPIAKYSQCHPAFSCFDLNQEVLAFTVLLFALEERRMDWFGADPGGTRKGKPCFGVAWLRKNGSFETSATDCAHSALRWIQKHSVVPLAIGIDCPLWWSSMKSGERQVDVLLRRKYRDHGIGSSVQALNSLPGAVLVQGMMLAGEARKHWKDVKITETHPRALLKAMHLTTEPWSTIAGKFDLDGPEPETRDQWDALLSAAVARNGYKHLWTVDLTDLPRGEGEMDPQHTFFGRVNYYWFERIPA